MIGILDLIHIAQIVEIFEDYGQYSNGQYYKSLNNTCYLFEQFTDNGMVKSAALYQYQGSSKEVIYVYDNESKNTAYNEKAMEKFLFSAKSLDVSFKNKLQSFYREKHQHKSSPSLIKKFRP